MTLMGFKSQVGKGSFLLSFAFSSRPVGRKRLQRQGVAEFVECRGRPRLEQRGGGLQLRRHQRRKMCGGRLPPCLASLKAAQVGQMGKRGGFGE